MYDKRNREGIGRVEDQINSLLGKVRAQGRKGLNSEERERWQRLMTEHNDLQASVLLNEGANFSLSSALDRSSGGGARVSDLALEEIRDTFRMRPAERRRRDRGQDPHARAFGNYLRFGMEGVSADDRAALQFVPNGEGAITIHNAQSTSPGTQGGFLVPEGFSRDLMSAMKWFGGISGVVGEFDTSTGNPMPWPTINDTTNKGRILGQNVQSVETDLVFNQVTFNAFIGSSDLILVPLSLMQDSYFDLDGLVARLLGIRLGRLLNWKCTVGAGTTEPTGIVTAAVAAGNILTLPTGEPSSISYNNLVDLEGSVDPSYRYNPSSYFMFSDAMLKLLKKLVDGNNRPLWQPGLTASLREGALVDLTSSRPTILDHPYIINQDMAAPAASQYSMLFGDMSTFKVRKVADGVTVMRLIERYADYLQVGFQAFLRFDSQLVDAGTHPLAVMQQSAS